MSVYDLAEDLSFKKDILKNHDIKIRDHLDEKTRKFDYVSISKERLTKREEAKFSVEFDHNLSRPYFL